MFLDGMMLRRVVVNFEADSLTFGLIRR